MNPENTTHEEPLVLIPTKHGLPPLILIRHDHPRRILIQHDHPRRRRLPRPGGRQVGPTGRRSPAGHRSILGTGVTAVIIGALLWVILAPDGWRPPTPRADGPPPAVADAPPPAAGSPPVAAPAGSLTTTPGHHSVVGPPTLTADQIDRILAAWNSPAVGTGSVWVAHGMAYGIDPAYALAFFIHESGAGTAPGWAGRKPDGSTTHNIGNIICAGYPTCYGRFRDYPSWNDGIADWYRLIAVEYIGWRGVHTVEAIVPIYAPASENNVDAYIATVNRLVAEWRAHP